VRASTLPALRARCLGTQRLGDALDDFLLRRKAIPSLRRDNFSSDGDLENPGVTFDERCFDAELLFQRSRRTGGLGEVASGGAIGDGDHVDRAS
jgi:hypothetical protein